jgi:hypothetical protein
MGDFEWAIVNALNSFFQREGLNAIAYRLKQSRFSSQFMDILVDSRNPEYYLALECKSLDARKTKSLYFKQHWSLAGGEHQLKRETDFLVRSGRQGILAVELRRGGGKPRTAHLVPWGQVFQIYKEGRPGLALEEISLHPPLDRKGGEYHISRLDIVRISGYQDLALGEGSLDELDLDQSLDQDAEEYPD